MKSLEDLLDNWIRSSIKNQYFFIITKSCGYEFIVTAYKNQNILELHENIKLETGTMPRLSISKGGVDIRKNHSSIMNMLSIYHEHIECMQSDTHFPSSMYRLWLK
jgi:hypothetical protein